MTITNKFPGRCSVCSVSVEAAKGTAVKGRDGKWSVRCAAHSGGGPAPAPSGPRPPKAPRAARKARRAKQPGEIEIHNKTGYDVGATIHAPRIAGGGGPDGHYWTVMHTYFSRANEDMGQYDDLHYAYARPATDDECSPLIARARAAKSRRTCEEVLAAAPVLTSVSDTGRLPPAAEIEASVVVGRKTGSSGAVTDGGTTYALTATSIVAHHGGYYDDYRSTTRTIARTDELAQIIVALATGDVDAIGVYADRIESRS